MKEAPSKPQLFETIAEATRARGGEIIRLGGDCYVSRIQAEVRLAIALKESGAKKKMWVGSPEPMTRLLFGQYRLTASGEALTTRADRVTIALIHKPSKTVMLIPLMEVWTAIVTKAQANQTDLEWSFDVEMKGYHKYVVKQGAYRPEIPIVNVGTLEPAIALLDQALPAVS